MTDSEVNQINDIQVFNNPEFGEIRTVTIDNELWFVGKDVAEALGYSNSRDALAKHVYAEDKDTVAFRDGTAGNPMQTVINESGVYALIFGSKLESARRFKRWVTHDVLPAIRKTGTYSIEQPKVNSLKDVLTYVELVREAMKDQNADSEAIAKAMMEAGEQYGVKFPKHFVQPKETTMKDLFDMVDYVASIPKSKRDSLTYEDFVISQTIRIQPKLGRRKQYNNNTFQKGEKIND